MRIRPEVEPIKMFARAEDKKLQSEIDFFMMFKHGRGRSREGCTFSTAITSRVFELHYTICCAFAAIDWLFFKCRNCFCTCRCQLLLELFFVASEETFSRQTISSVVVRQGCECAGTTMSKDICSRYTSKLEYNFS